MSTHSAPAPNPGGGERQVADERADPGAAEAPAVAASPGSAAAGDGDEDRLARVALMWLAEPGNRTVYDLVRTIGAAETVRRLVRGEVPDGRLRAGLGARLAAGHPLEYAEAALRRAERLGARVVTPADDEWPAQVQDLERLELAASGRLVDCDTRPPLCLWVRGEARLDQAAARSVAVVGARACTSYGEHVAMDLAHGLADRQWTVVSGGAYGIDAVAHRAALAANGVTLVVLAGGVDRPYPAGNTALFDRILDAGLLISEWAPGAEPLRHRFLIRNRLIAAATAGTVVVEAAARSGAAQTLGRAHALGRRAMAVPGPVTSTLSVGCHELLRNLEHARLVTGVPHVMEEVGRIGADLAPAPRGPEYARDGLDEDSARLLEYVPRRGLATPDQIAARAGLDLRAVLRRLPLLEDLGLVVRRDGAVGLPRRPGAPS
jgi:DNA processing protein